MHPFWWLQLWSPRWSVFCTRVPFPILSEALEWAIQVLHRMPIWSFWWSHPLVFHRRYPSWSLSVLLWRITEMHISSLRVPWSMPWWLAEWSVYSVSLEQGWSSLRIRRMQFRHFRSWLRRFFCLVFLGYSEDIFRHTEIWCQHLSPRSLSRYLMRQSVFWQPGDSSMHSQMEQRTALQNGGQQVPQ